MSEILTESLERLSRIPGVRGVLVVDPVVGVTVVSDLAGDLDGAALAALASTVYRQAKHATEAASFGKLDVLQLEAELGHVVVADAGELIVVAVAEEDAQLGLVRFEAQRTAEEMQ